METKTVSIETKEISGRTITGVAAIFGVMDDGFDVIHPRSFRKTIKERKERIRHLWQHDYSMPPIAKIEDLYEIGKADLPEKIQGIEGIQGGLEVVRTYLETPRADEVFKGVQAGAINEMSFGYDPVKWDFEEFEPKEGYPILRRHLRELRLWDTSDVVWGMQSLTVAEKSVVPFLQTGKEAESADWIEPSLADFTPLPWEVLSDAEKMRISAHYSFSLSYPVEQFEDLKLAHHRAGTSAIGPVVWAGVKSAMAGLVEFRNMDPKGKKAVFSHLAQHYIEFKKEPLDYRLLEVFDAISLNFGVLESFLPMADNLKLKSAMSRLKYLLDRAEPESYIDEMLAQQLNNRLNLLKAQANTL